MEGFFTTLTDLGIQLIDFARTDMIGLVEWFITPIGELNSALSTLPFADYTVLTLMFGAGIPLYLLYTLISYLANIIT